MIKRILFSLGFAVLLLIGVLLFNTFTYGVPESANESAGTVDLAKVDTQRVARNLGAAIRFKTISHQNPADFEQAEFTGFNSWLEATYPAVHAKLERTMAGGLTPIYKWQGADASLKPVMLTGHYDVVPVLPETLEDWEQPPFSGNSAGGFVWGRGALDDKIAIIGILEAAEKLLETGFEPKRTVYFIFGHDEEVGGWQGAGRAVHALKKRGVEMEWTLDEGSMVLDGIIPGIKRPVASINVAEKGYVTLDLKAKAKGGHSSLPPTNTAVGILATAIKQLEDNPVPGGLTDVTADFFDSMAPSFPFVQRMLFANRWLFGSILEGQMAKSAATNALMRTTTAPTMLSASLKENVLPSQAVATVNFRIHPRDTVESVTAYINSIIADDRVEISVRGESVEPSPVSRHEVRGFAQLSKTFKDVFGELIVGPGLTIAATDSKHYCRIAQDCFRINPIVFASEDIPRIHGTNERISLENLEKVVQFYTRLLQSVDG